MIIQPQALGEALKTAYSDWASRPWSIVFIHDLSPDNGDLKDSYATYFEQAVKGAMPELTKMKEERHHQSLGIGR